MEDTSNKLTQNKAQPLDKPKKLGLPGLHGRMQAATAAANAAGAVAPAEMPNRIVLMLDVSGSMAASEEGGKSRIEHLKDAIMGFLAACDWKNTAVGLETFGNSGEELHIQLQTNAVQLQLTAMTLHAHGGTPMHDAMEQSLISHPLTRGVIVSDGQANDPHTAEELAKQFAEARIPIDTVHIGSESYGADLLQKIAEITGGLFIKFTDIASFSKNFKYLTPGYRAMLTTGSSGAGAFNDAAALLGAKEVK